MRKRILSLVLVFALLIPYVPAAAATETGMEPTVTVESVYAAAGEDIEVDISIANNPGILGATLKVTYDSALTLTAAKNGEVFSMLSMTKPGTFKSGCNFVWDGQEINDEDIKDGVILTLSFTISETAEAGKELPIVLSYTNGAIINKDLKPVSIEIVSGAISVLDYVPGDLNGDGFVTTPDIILLRRHIAGDYELENINEMAGDVNDDGMHTSLDVILIRRFIADGCVTDPEGYNVTLLPSRPRCKHSLTATPYKAASCTEYGNIAYWYCSLCEKYFSNEEGTAEIALENTVIDATGHNEVIDPAVPATSTSTGLTEGAHCDICGTVTVKQETIPMLQPNTQNISYDIANGDPYLEALLAEDKVENANPSTFAVENGLTLKNLSVAGYRFLGWYDGAGDNAEQIKKIAAGTDYDVELYAHWEKVEYTVQFKSSLFVDEASDTYTVDTGMVLPTPKLSNYVFTGWSDENGKLYKNTTIPVGSTGNITLTGNWTSERNKTWSKTKLDAPIVYEDEENNTILFAYEIGEIQNVPLYTIKDFGYIAGDGVTKTETTTFSTTISESLMESYAKSVASATTESSDWTLSDEWNESTSIDEQWCTENGYEKEEAIEKSKSSSSNWNVSSGTSGSTEIVTTDSNQNELRSEAKIGNTTTDSNKVSTYNKKSESVTGSLNTTLDIGVETTASVENTATVGAEIGSNWGLGGGGANVGGSSSVSASNSLKTGLSTTVSRNFSVEAGLSSTSGSESGGSEDTEHKEVVEKSTTDTQGVTTMHSNSATNTSSWNSSSSYGGSNESSVSESTKYALTEKISKTTGYGKSYILGGSSSNTQGFETSRSDTDEYTSSVTYSTVTQEEQTRSWTTQATKPGYHRWVIAGTAHVFAVVGYDMETESYFVYTCSIMDDETHEFEDYSYTTASYNDHENGVIPFEIPGPVYEYVANRTNSSAGLKVNMDTGVIESYTGDFTCVVIPEYMNVGNGDVVKITGISETAFQGNKNIKAVILSDFIEEIPANAFAYCSSLIGVAAANVKRIGENAFAGCYDFEEALVSEQVESMGINAFAGVKKLTVNASNAEVVKAAVASGAKKLVLNLDVLEGDTGVLSGVTLTIPSNVEYFELNGAGKTLNGVRIISNAGKTVINKLHLIGDNNIPLQISSSEVVLNQCTVSAEGIALALTAENANVGLQGTISVDSNSTNAMLCKNVTLYESNASVVGAMSVPDKILVCGEISAQGLLTFGASQTVDEETFNRKLNYYTLYFDGNGVNCQTVMEDIPNGASVGTLPKISRENYIFDGWHLEDGTLVTENAKFPSGSDQHLRAHWIATKVVSLAFASKPSKTSYYVGDTFSSSGMSITATYNDGTTKTLATGEYSVINPDMKSAGTKKLTVKCGDASAQCDITVKELTVSLSANKTTASSGYVTLKATVPCGTVTWSSSDTKVATVNSSGKVTFGNTMGKATITATVNNNGCTKSASTTLTLSNTSGTKYKETSSSSTSSVLYASHPSGYSTALPVTGSIPSYTTSSSDITGGTTTTNTGKVVTSYTNNGVAGYVYYQFNYNSSGGADNIYKIVNYQEGWRYNLGSSSSDNFYHYTSYGRQFYSTTNYPEHEANAGWTKYYAIWWAYQDKQAGHTWYVAKGIDGARAASWFRFPVYNYTKTTTTYTYYYYTLS